MIPYPLHIFSLFSGIPGIDCCIQPAERQSQIPRARHGDSSRQSLNRSSATDALAVAVSPGKPPEHSGSISTRTWSSASSLNITGLVPMTTNRHD